MQTGSKPSSTQPSFDGRLDQHSAPTSEERAPSSSGFAGRLDGASVADLIQLECAAGRTQAIKVQSRGRTGYLCFERGRLAHAIAPGAVGDAAVLQILCWPDGAFEPARVRWPATPTVRSSWQHLLLAAAQAQDETARGKVVEFPPSQSSSEDSIVESSQVVDAQVLTAGTASRPPLTGHSMQHADASLDLGLEDPTPLRRWVTCAVRLAPGGQVLASRGDAESFAAMVAYAKRLSDLIGDALGAGKLRALKCTTADTQVHLYEEESGNLVGIQSPSSASLPTLDGKLGV